MPNRYTVLEQPSHLNLTVWIRYKNNKNEESMVYLHQLIIKDFMHPFGFAASFIIIIDPSE